MMIQATGNMVAPIWKYIYRSLLEMLITEEAERFYEPFGFRKDPICFMTRKETLEAITNE